MHKKIILLLIILILTGCTKSVSEITNDDYVGKTVAVRGVAEAPLKIGQLSGYTLVDANGDKILVGSQRLPAEGDKVIARGTLRKGFGIYYIEVI